MLPPKKALEYFSVFDLHKVLNYSFCRNEVAKEYKLIRFVTYEEWEFKIGSNMPLNFGLSTSPYSLIGASYKARKQIAIN